ncbi:type II secretion system protein [bacterium]|nr:type II secretion system protein [bacterium]
MSTFSHKLMFSSQIICKRKSKTAFTLAEVLITLGIIGVVAALTLPMLIQNYQKGVALNRLKQTYAQILNAVEITAAENDAGPMGTWGCPRTDFTDPDTGVYYWMPWTQACFYMAMKKIAVKMYPRPDDVSHAFCFEGDEYRPYTALDGTRGRWNTNGNMLHTGGYSAKLPNGACVVWHPAVGSHDAGGSLIIDVDGSYAGFNRAGKDVFVFSYLVNGSNASTYGKNGRTILPGRHGSEEKTRAQLKEKCSKAQSGANGTECSALIMYDGWQIKPDYPW